jgi:CRP-like cAMP-binding protein
MYFVYPFLIAGSSGSIQDESTECVHIKKMNPRINEIIGSIPEKEYQYFEENMKLVSLEKNQILFDAGRSISHAYFPVGAVISMMNDMTDGSGVETHMLGKSCMVGIGSAGNRSFYRAKVRSSGLAYRLPMHCLRTAWAQCPVYAQNVQKAMQRMLLQLSQTVVCSKKHNIDQQLIRWILMTLDNTLSSTIAMTHQEMSELLGYRREAISMTMHKLSKLALISTSRGEFTVISRERLEAFSCDCYWLGRESARPGPHALHGGARPLLLKKAMG